MDRFEDFPAPRRWLIGVALLFLTGPGCGSDQPVAESPASPATESTVGEAAPKETVPEQAGLELEPVPIEQIEQLPLEAIGCWFLVAGERAPRLFAGSGRAVIKAEGKLVVLQADPTTAVGEWGLATEFVGDGYRASFSALSDSRRTSIESEEYEATLEVLSPAAETGLLMGLVACGV